MIDWAKIGTNASEMFLGYAIIWKTFRFLNVKKKKNKKKNQNESLQIYLESLERNQIVPQLKKEIESFINQIDIFQMNHLPFSNETNFSIHFAEKESVLVRIEEENVTFVYSQKEMFFNNRQEDIRKMKLTVDIQSKEKIVEKGWGEGAEVNEMHHPVIQELFHLLEMLAQKKRWRPQNWIARLNEQQVHRALKNEAEFGTLRRGANFDVPIVEKYITFSYHDVGIVTQDQKQISFSLHYKTENSQMLVFSIQKETGEKKCTFRHFDGEKNVTGELLDVPVVRKIFEILPSFFNLAESKTSLSSILPSLTVDSSLLPSVQCVAMEIQEVIIWAQGWEDLEEKHVLQKNIANDFLGIVHDYMELSKADRWKKEKDFLECMEIFKTYLKRIKETKDHKMLRAFENKTKLIRQRYSS